MRHFSRRRFLQALGAAATSHYLPAVNAQTSALPPVNLPDGKPFNNIELTYFQDSIWYHAPLWLSDIFRREAGVGIATRETYDGGEAIAKLLPQLLVRRARCDWAQIPSLFFGYFAETGLLEPLDAYFEKYESGSAYLDWVMPAYGEFYTQWAGQRYGIMLDGDIHVLHYRRNHFADPALQRKFSSRFQRELAIPKTWPDFLDAVQFFTEELSSQGIYGTSMISLPPNFGWGFWMNIAASNGVNYFDEQMNPGINTPAAVEALDMYREIIRFGPPEDREQITLAKSIDRWQKGLDVMSIFWIDLAEFTAASQGALMAEQQGADIVPGWQQADGSIIHRALSLWCRTGVIPANLPQDVKDAAFYFLYRMSHPAISDEIVADEYCGSDPYGRSHYTDEAAQKYLQPNPQRGIGELWPTNNGIFKTFLQARNHLDAGLKNIKVGYPQFYWEGAGEFADALGRNINRAVRGQLTSQQALDEAAEEWVKIVQNLGIDKQKAQYQNFLQGARKLNYKI